MNKKIVFILMLIVFLFPFVVEAKPDIHTDSENSISSSELETIKSIVKTAWPTGNYDWILLNSSNSTRYTIFAVNKSDGLSVTPSLTYDTNNLLFRFAYRGLLYINKENYTYDISYYLSDKVKFASVLPTFVYYNDEIVDYKSYDNFYTDLGIDFTNSSTYQDLHLYFPIVYASSSVTIDKSYYDGFAAPSVIDKFTTIFGSDGTLKTFSFQPRENDSYSYDTRETVLNYNGTNNSVIELIFKASDDSKKDSCTWNPFGNICIGSNSKITDFLNLYINSNQNFVSNVYYSNDKENWTLLKDFPSRLSLQSFNKNYETISRFTNSESRYLKYVITLEEEQTLFVNAKYSAKYVEFEYSPIVYDDDYFSSYDMTGKYAIALIPKTDVLNHHSSIKYLGDYTVYLSDNKNVTAFDYKQIVSSELIPYSFNTNTYAKNIIYIINNKHKDSEYVSTIKYLEEKYDLVYFENELSSISRLEENYNAPSVNIDISNDSGSINNGNSFVDFSDGLSYSTNIVESLTSAFAVFGTCLSIMFASFPPLVISTLIICGLLVVLIIIKKTIF